MALRNLIVRVGADVTGLSTGLRNAQRQVQFFGRNVTGSMKELSGGIAKVAASIGSALTLKEGISDAMRYEALMATLGESMGDSRKDFEKWMETTGNAFGFSRLQAANTANILSLNFKKISTSQADLTAKTTKMMEIAGLVANKRGMTMEEVSDRIRSAMNQEADGADELGVNVRAAALMQSKAYKELGNNQPFDKLSEATRKTILYESILEQVTANLGSTMQDTTAARMASFTASLADLRMGLGQAFLPIVYAVLPYLTMLAKALFYVMGIIAAFMRSLFGGGFKYKAPVSKGDIADTNKQATALDNVGKSAEKAGNKSAKAAKKSKQAWSGTFGFDEVNAIKDPAATDAGAGAGAGGGVGGGKGVGGGGLPPIETPTLNLTAFNEAVDAMAKAFDKYTKPIKDAAKAIWSAISGFAKEEFGKISKWWSENGDQIIQALKNLWAIVGPIIMFLVQFIWDSIKGLVDGIITFFEGVIEFFTGVFTGDWGKAWQGIKDMVFGAVEAIWNFTNLTLFGGIKKLILNLVKDGAKIFLDFSGDIIKFFSHSWDEVVKGVLAFIKGTTKFFKDFGAWFEDHALGIAHGVMDAFTAIGKVGKTIWDAIKWAFNGAVDWFVRTVISPITTSFQQIKDAFSKGIGEGFKTILNLAITGFNKALGLFNKLKNATPLGGAIPDLHIPTLARGGITNGPTLALIGDNRGGREVVSPLDQLQTMMATTVVQAMQLGNAATNRNSGDIILNIDGRAFARIVQPFMQNELNRAGTDIRIRTI